VGLAPTARGDAWADQPRHLIRDRDRCYGADFIARATRIGIHTVLTPVRAPNANAIAERVIGTLRRECLDHLIVLTERHLLRLLQQYVVHYNAMRPHRSLAHDSPQGRQPELRPPAGRLVSRPVLSGLHHEYEWAAEYWRPTATRSSLTRRSTRQSKEFTATAPTEGAQCVPRTEPATPARRWRGLGPLDWRFLCERRERRARYQDADSRAEALD